MGKSIVITGAGMGLGRAMARRFAKDGDTVILLGRTFSKVKALADELGAPALAVECDVASPDSVRAAFATIAQSYPTIDVLINNAAVYEPFTVAEGTDEQIQSIINTNLTGAIFCARAAIPMMQKGSQIINVGSESIAEPFVMLSLYEASKAGLEHFTQALEKELEPQGIRVCTVRAGPMYEDGKERPNWNPDAAMRFAQGCAANGLNMMERPVSQVTSVTDVFRAVIDLPPDVKVMHVSVGARHP
ncbi:MAG: SDR family oxidoreductase [Novosphingobium sp.]|nr:SDR family oxidoreductase [Novosphingobium sp.]